MEKAKPIQKKLLHAGVGPSDIDIPDGTKLKFHFVTKKIDGTLLDDSRKWDKPMELLIGKKFKLEAWEMCLKTMRLQEVSSFVVKRVYGINSSDSFPKFVTTNLRIFYTKMNDCTQDE